MTWSFDDNLPIYLQIIRILKYELARGKYQPGEKLPAVRELAMTAGVNPNTMQKALAELERDGLVKSQRTAGRFVTDDKEKIMDKAYLVREVKSFLMDEDGVGVIELVLILVVLIGLVIVFKKQINTLLTNIFKQINSKSKEVY